MSDCSLCALPTPDPPVTAPDVDGEFCCQGCLEVSTALDDAPTDETALRDRVHEHGSDTGEADRSDRETPDGYQEAFLAVNGMHCTTCEAFVSLLGEDASGVEQVEVSYATELARVVYDPNKIGETDLPEALSGHGYSAHLDEETTGSEVTDETVQRLLVGGFCAMLVMPWYLFYLYPSYIGIDTGILDPGASAASFYVPFGIIGLLTTVVVLYTGAPVLRGAYASIRTRRPNMDLLIAVAALAAWTYSTIALVLGDTHLYYDVSVAVIMVVTLGSYYEGSIKDDATSLLSDLTTASVDEATLRTEDGTETVSVTALSPDDEVIVRAGDRIPVDGTVIEGRAPVDESLLTGESLPETKVPGDSVAGGTVAHDALVIAVGDDADSTIDRIATMLWSIQTATPGAQRFVDRLSTVFVPFVFLLATAATAAQLWLGASTAGAVLTGLTVLVVSCPCAMGLATPLAVAGGLRDALERGIVVANQSVFETAPDADVVVFDKTGTLTEGEMVVQEIIGNEHAVAQATAIERRAQHPVADAIVNAVDSEDGVGVDAEPPAPGTVHRFERHPGEGVAGVVGGARVVAGTVSLVEDRIGTLPQEIADAASHARESGSLPVVVGTEATAVADGGIDTETPPTGRGSTDSSGAQRFALVVVGDHERKEWTEAIEAVADREVVVLTGDDPSAAKQFREHDAVDTVFAGVPPDGKVETIRRLRTDQTVAMVGDGTNDAPALAAADLGIAMGSGTASAADAADAIVTDDDLRSVGTVFDLADGTRRRVRENVGWALLYNATALPLAAASLINPLFAAVAMAVSSVLVVTNSSRSVL